uniref:Lipoprotein n=1 Tax=Parastrongyloides trichosuri TaxID=131310 RepID=A0A0N4ZHB6_PARTI
MTLATCTIGENENIDDSNWKETYATLYKYGYGRGAVNMVYYRVDGKRYELNSYFDANGKAIGDKYLIKYNPYNPEQIKEYIWYVSFLTTEKTEEAIGKVEDVWSKNIEFGRIKRYGISFVYIINGEKYERTQYLQPDYKDVYPNLSAGQEYKVLYWDKNPQPVIAMTLMLSLQSYSQSMKDYSDKDLTISYPETWENMTYPKTVFLLIRPVEEQGQKFRENVNLIISESKGLTLDEYGALAKLQLQKHLKNVEIITTNNKTIGGNPWESL